MASCEIMNSRTGENKVLDEPKTSFVPDSKEGHKVWVATRQKAIGA